MTNDGAELQSEIGAGTRAVTCVPAPSPAGFAQPGERAGAAGRRARRGVPRRALPRTEDGQCAQVRQFFFNFNAFTSFCIGSKKISDSDDRIRLTR